MNACSPTYMHAPLCLAHIHDIHVCIVRVNTLVYACIHVYNNIMYNVPMYAVGTCVSVHMDQWARSVLGCLSSLYLWLLMFVVGNGRDPPL